MKNFKYISVFVALLLLKFTFETIAAQSPNSVQNYSAILVDDLERANVYLASEQYQSSILLLDSIIEKAIELNNLSVMADAYLLRGKSKLVNVDGRDKPTLDLLEALNLFQKIGDEIGIANCYLQIGLVNYDIENYTTAVVNFEKILNLDLVGARVTAIAQYLLAIANSELKNYEKAESMFDLAAANFGTKDTTFILLIEIFRAKLYINEGKSDRAIETLNKLTQEYQEYLVYDYIMPINAFLSSAYHLNNDYENAIKYGSRVFDPSLNKGVYSIYIREAAESLHQSYFQKRMYDSAYYYLNVLSSFEDSLTGIHSLHRITELNEQYEFEQKLLIKKAEQDVKDAIAARTIERQKFTRNISIGAFFLALLIALLIYNQRVKLAREKEKSDQLLLNILPADIAEELKQNGHSEARQYQKVCIIFTDFKDFTPASAKLSAGDLVNEINYFFEAFDKICKKYSIEKIKTIGDAYMAVGGLPKPSDESVKKTVLAGLEMQDFVARIKLEGKHKINFEMRVGIHSGPVVAGIVGLNKFQYDIWGDTVNTASRMESNGEVGKVNISKSVYDEICLDPEFVFQFRGKIEAKGKGKIDMYFVDRA